MNKPNIENILGQLRHVDKQRRTLLSQVLKDLDRSLSVRSIVDHCRKRFPEHERIFNVTSVAIDLEKMVEDGVVEYCGRTAAGWWRYRMGGNR